MSGSGVATRRRTAPVRLAIASVALLLAGACSGGGGEDEAIDTTDDSALDRAVPADDTTVPSDDEPGEAAPAADTGEAPADPAATETTPPPTPAGGGTGDQGAAPAPAPADASPAPAATAVPKAGTYTYTRTVKNSEGTETTDSDVSVERLGGDDRSGRLRIVMESEQGQLTNEASFSDAGLLVERSAIASPLGNVECDWERDWYVHGALAEGSTWTVDTSCQDTTSGIQVQVAISGSGAVVGVEQIAVAGATVTAWVLETTIVTEVTVKSATLNGTQRSETTARVWMDPARGMQVRDESRTESSGAFENGTSEIVSEFVSFAAR